MDFWAIMSGSLLSILLQHGRYKAGIDDIQKYGIEGSQLAY